MSKFVDWIKAAYKLYTAHESEVQAIASAVQTIYGDATKKGVDAARALMLPEAVRAEVYRLNLLRHPAFDLQTAEVWARVWNGYGPDSWPAPLRDMMTWIYRHQQPVAGPHDDWYSRSDGTRETWRIVMDQWIVNASIVLADRYPLARFWLWPERAAEWAKMRLAIRALELGSYDAWLAAFRHRNL